MNRIGLKWWQIVIAVNFAVAFICLIGMNVEQASSLFVLAYAAVSTYLLKYVPTDKIKGYDDIA